MHLFTFMEKAKRKKNIMEYPSIKRPYISWFKQIERSQWNETEDDHLILENHQERMSFEREDTLFQLGNTGLALKIKTD